MSFRSDCARLGPIPQSILLGFGVGILCLAGIYSRTVFDLATLWPANAFMLGMLVRFPQLRHRLSWIVCAAAFLGADALTNASLLNNLLLNGCNLASVAIVYAVLARHSPQNGWFGDPTSALVFLRAVALAAMATGLLGIVSHQLLFGGTAREGFLLWAASELVNYITVLPIILTLPQFGPWQNRRKVQFPQITAAKLAPIVTLIATAGAGHLVGGPGALAFPVPALLWCALTFPPFATGLFSFAFAIWAQLAVRTGMLDLGHELGTRELLISTRTGIALIALAPLFLVSVMAARHRMLERLVFLAERDTLTNLRNRRSFLETGAGALESAIASRSGAAVMMLDLDFFKSINDKHGHGAGDQVLIAFAQILRDHLRSEAVIGRVGGEEFAIIVPHCGMSEAEHLAKRINQEVRALLIPLDDDSIIQVTTSIGIKLVTATLTLEQALIEADKALYQAKASGRDRYEIWPA
jgi:diguanylate cyclase (GGDEF)-like protein